MSLLPFVQSSRLVLLRAVACALLPCALAACGEETAPRDDVAAASGMLVVECVDVGEDVPSGSWVCGEPRIVECGSHDGAEIGSIHASLAFLDVAATCDELALEPSEQGPFSLGEHVIQVSDAGDAPLCASILTVVDTTPPRAGGAYLELWPPNHKLYWLSPEECAAGAADTCDPDVNVELVYASSDEPVDEKGDGDTEEDIVGLGCDGVSLRAERSGRGDGRVYRVGYRVTDHAGNAAEGACVVVVRHDQGDAAPVHANEEAYRVVLGCG